MDGADARLFTNPGLEAEPARSIESCGHEAAKHIAECADHRSRSERSQKCWLPCGHSQDHSAAWHGRSDEELSIDLTSGNCGLSGSVTRNIRPEFVIRPGVRFPDWSFIQSTKAEAALLAMFRAVRVERRWTDHSPTLDRVRVAILRGFAASGYGPRLVDLAHATGIPIEEVSVLLDELARRDLVVLGQDGRVTGAYPFTSLETEHSVRRGALQLRAMCAIDALGIGAMLEEDVDILSSCRACASPIRVRTAGKGTALQSIEPAEAVVRVGEDYEGNCGARSLCASIAFFCSDAHLDEWSSSAGATGHRLKVKEAHQVGCAIFGPSLRRLDAEFS